MKKLITTVLAAALFAGASLSAAAAPKAAETLASPVTTTADLPRPAIAKAAKTSKKTAKKSRKVKKTKR